MDDQVTVQIRIPRQVLADVEEQSQARGETLSQFFCRGAQTLLRRHKERRMLEEYVESRSKMPDPAEIEDARKVLEDVTDEEDA